MTSVNQLKKDLETVKHALNLAPEPNWKKKSEEINRLLRETERRNNAFAQLPTEEKQRIIQELKDSPATDFTGGDPQLTMYAEVLKKATIRDLERMC